MRLVSLDGLEPKVFPKPSRRAVTLQCGPGLRFESTAAEAMALADALVDLAEQIRRQPNGRNAIR